jgi:uncharacterized membrane protein (UPF0136 family)
MFKKNTCLIVLFYGLLLILLGIIGYYNSGSKPSLIMGGGFGLIMLMSSKFLFSKNKVGIFTSIFATILLTITFAIRFNASGKMLPGVMALASGAMLAFLATQVWNERKHY